MPKLPFQKESSGINYPIDGEDKGVHTFPKGIYPKVNVIARSEFEHVYCN